MFRAKILRALALGLCMSVLYTGAAFARSGEGSSPSFAGMIEENSAMYEKQREIDQILFVDKAEEIAAQGIKIAFTVVAGDMVEVAVAPLTDESADYLYGILDKDLVKLVDAEEAQIYTTMAVDPAQAPEVKLYDSEGEPVGDKELLYGDVLAGASDADVRVYKGTDAVIADDGVEPENPDVIFYTTTDGVAESGQEAELVYATGERAEVVKAAAEADQTGLSTPVIILLIAGGVLVIGGGALAAGKRRQAR
jgi:LPXTG-motif cell wall-anchored protein